jgi:hypothetical protein
MKSSPSHCETYQYTIKFGTEEEWILDVTRVMTRILGFGGFDLSSDQRGESAAAFRQGGVLVCDDLNLME